MEVVDFLLDGLEAALELERELGVRSVEIDRGLLGGVVGSAPAVVARPLPAAAAQTLKSGYSMSVKKNGSGYVLTLKPKAKSNVTSVTLYISSAYVLTKAVYTTKKGSETLTISNYKTNVSTTAATFKFDKKQVPAGTEVVDLR